MTTLLALLAGLGTGIGLLLVAYGIRQPDLGLPDVGGSRAIARWWATVRSDPATRRRTASAVAAGVVGGLVTGWPIAHLLGAAGGWIAPTIAGSGQQRDAAVQRTEDLATWAEQLRDTIGSAAGLQDALAATATTAPRSLREPLALLVADLRHRPLGDLLDELAHRLAEPVADQIIVSLTLAADRSGQNLTAVLGDVADAARADADMRRRTETSRAQTYADARAVTVVILAVFGFLLVLNRGYLDPYEDILGQLVLAVIGGMWLVAIAGLGELARIQTPPRLLHDADPSSVEESS